MHDPSKGFGFQETSWDHSMKILFLTESPIEKKEGRYYAVDSWIRFPIALSKVCAAMSIWSPVKVLSATDEPHPRSWIVELEKARLIHHDYYYTFAGYYRLWPRKRNAWKTKATDLLKKHDLLCVRVGSPMLPLVAKIALGLGKPYIVFVTGDIEAQSDRVLHSKGFKRFVYERLVKIWVRKEVRWCQNASIVYVYSNDLKERHRNARGELIPFRTPHLTKQDIWKRQDTCQNSKTRILRVAWLLPSKGYEVLFRSIEMLKQGGEPVELQVVGQERVKGYEAYLKNLAKTLKIDDCVSFAGWIPYDRIGETYVNADIQVISSLAEGTPRCIVEGFAKGLPLVCTTAGGSRDVLRDGYHALLVEPGNSVSITQAIRRLIHDRSLRRTLIGNGYEMANEVTFESVSDRIVSQMKKAVSSHQSPPVHK